MEYIWKKYNEVLDPYTERYNNQKREYDALVQKDKVHMAKIQKQSIKIAQLIVRFLNRHNFFSVPN